MAPKHLQLGAKDVLRQLQRVKKHIQQQQPELVIRMQRARDKGYVWERHMEVLQVRGCWKEAEVRKVRKKLP